MCSQWGDYARHVIVVEGLTKRFGSKVAVDNLSFSVDQGRVTGFLGPNGSGKSTTMRCMLDLDRPQAGSVTFGGRRYRELDTPISVVGSLLDAGDAHKSRSARNHLRWLAATSGIADSRVDEVLRIVGLTEVAKRRVGKFSLGMRQRLGLAAALLGDPAVLLLDEPANGLDPEGIRWTRDMMRYLAAEGKAVLVSSHQLGELSLVADDLVVIGQGRLISAGPVSQFVAQHARTWVHVESPDLARLVDLARSAGAQVEPEGAGADLWGIDAARVGELAAANGIVLHQLATRQGSLEDAFLQATDATVEYRGADVPAPPPDQWEAPQP